MGGIDTGFGKGGPKLGLGGGGGIDTGFGKPDLGNRPPKPPHPHGGGGGFFGGIGGFFHHLGSDAGNAITGLPTGVEHLGRDTWDTLTSHKAWHTLGEHYQTQAPLYTRDLHPMAKQYAHEYGPLIHGHFGQFGHQFYEHPLGPILDAATIATLGAGGAAKAGEIASQAGLISRESALANLGRASDLTVPGMGADEEPILIKQSARQPLVRYRQELVNKALNKLPSETPVMGSTARGVRALSRVAGKEAARMDVQARDFNSAFNKLTRPEKAAWHLKARGLDPEEYRQFLASQPNSSSAMQKILADPKVQGLVKEPSPRLQDALTRGRELSDRMTAHRVAAGMDEKVALESPYRHLRMMSGAKMEPVMGEAPSLTAANERAARIGDLHEHLLQAEEDWLKGTRNRNLGPLSSPDAHARMAELDKKYNDLIEKTIPHTSPYAREVGRSGRMYDPEQLNRNFVAGKTGKSMLTVKEEERQIADDAIRRKIAENPHDPAAQYVGRLLAERDRLRAVLQQHAEAPIFGGEKEPLPEAPAMHHASVPPPSNPFRDQIVRVGHQLEDAQAEAKRLSGKTAATGAVRLTGGKSVEDLIREIESAGGEHPFHVPDSAHVPGLKGGPRIRMRSTGFNAPDMATKQSQMILARHGLINPYENALGRDYEHLQNQVSADLLHDELLKHATIIRKGDEIPRGWDEIKVSRGQSSAPYTLRQRAMLEHELEGPAGIRQKIGEAGHLSQPRDMNGNFEEPHRLIVPKQVKRLLEDESKSYAGRLAAIRRVPINVWKGAVLGMRPAFFANITVGNSILGTLQMAPGRWGMVGWLNQVLPGFEKVAGKSLDEATMKDVFPEQVSGTFGGSVTPHGYHGSSRILRAGSRAAQGVMPATIGYENVLRRAMAEGWARSLPEVQSLLDKNGGDINDALRSIAKSHPQAIDNISRRVDNALGNYRTYNSFERAIKSVVPFYGWNRHITSSLARLASERPQVLDALLNTGLTGKAKANHILLPAYLAQAMPVHLPAYLGGQKGKGITTLFDPHSLNPFSTVTDEAKMAAFPFTGAGTESDAFPIAPDLQAAIEQLSGKSMLTGAPIKGNALLDELLNLFPQESLFTEKHPAKPTSVNQNRLYAQLLRILGIPVENVNRANAAKSAGPWRTINIPG